VVEPDISTKTTNNLVWVDGGLLLLVILLTKLN
jgi:hypothetical protein